MTLLKIAVDDASFEHRLTQLGPCLQTVQDSEKLTWIRTLAALGLKYPRRQYPILTLLITLLHQKESLAFKQDLMEIILGSPPSQETREIVLSSVCQWIDENHFSALSFTLLSFLATEAPKSLMPARYGPPIARHLASDDPALRLAAVNALAALASHHQKEIQALLRLSLQDHDPNVRQRTEQILQHPQSPPLPSPVLSLSLFFKQTPALHLSEPETEYPVRCLKYICARHIVFQFDCSNTLDHTLENLEVIMHSEEPRLIQTSHSSIPTLPFNTLGSLFVVYEHQHPNDLITASFHCQLRFSVKRTQEAILEDEYQLENVQLSLQDYLKPIRIDDFDATFDSFSTFGQTHHFHFLTTSTLQTACTALIRLLALQPLRDTALVRHPERHTLLLSGITLTEETVLVQAHLDCNSASLSASVCIRTHHKTIASHLFSFLDHSIKNSLF
ncbi:coatomer gamma subunit appendage platform subdomain-containing protein [Sporodiniella umbellata]|nr:coatomer gamma subunit appendage platform subdomain-containing protein [Sporodiniella umbellata]